MDNKTYLVRAFAVALLMWGSVAVVILIAQRPTPVTETATPTLPVAAAH